jgi:glycosyltransferase involved in cell wall biosynthesis
MTARPRVVAQITETLLMGGMEQVVVSLCLSMDRARWTPHVICLKSSGPLADACTAAGIPVYVAGEHSQSPYLTFLTIARHLREIGADVAHTHNTSGFIWGGLGILLAGTRRWVHTEHGRAFPDSRRRMLAERILSYRADAVVGVSSESTADLRRWVGVSAAKLQTIPNGVPAARIPTPDRAGARAALGIGPDVPVIGTLARLVPEKGVDRLLRVFAQVRASIPNALLVVCGDGVEQAALDAQASALGIRSSVQFLGMRLDATRLLAAFDVFALTSIREGLPMALLESLAASVPIASMDVGGVARAVRHEVTGVLVPPGDEDALATALVELLRDPARRARLGAEGRRIFLDEFTAGAMWRRYEQLYLAGTADAGGPSQITPE